MKMFKKYGMVQLLLLLIWWSCQCECTHVKGTFKSREFFKLLVKFGAQKTDRHQPEATRAYIFGNVTSEQHFPYPVTLALLDKAYFKNFYGSRTYYDKNLACRQMFSKLKERVYDSKCSRNGKDYLRRVPCEEGGLCPDEDDPWNVVRGHQFTFVIQDFREPKFWYLSLVGCYHNATACDWFYYEPAAPYSVAYDVWLVNGSPNGSAAGALAYQFSFDKQNTLELYLVFWACYAVLVPLQCHAARAQHHPVTRLFTLSLLLDFLALCLSLAHALRYALDGEGWPRLAMAGDISDILSRTTFMLLLLLLAKGWAVTRLELTWKPLVLAIWLCYGVVHILLYVWNLTEVDVIEDVDEYQTWPGWLMLVFRTLIMVWFLYELRITMLYEHNMQKLHFLLHFGASSLVWFIYLPILALIALHVSPLWRFKLLLGITYSADVLAYCVMAHLLWPTRSEQYFLLRAPPPADSDELDEFNEAPHVINASYASASTLHLASCDDHKAKLIAD